MDILGRGGCVLPFLLARYPLSTVMWDGLATCTTVAVKVLFFPSGIASELVRKEFLEVGLVH